ncbi:MAG: ABC transporter permease subunit [Thermoproteota archaeon]|nr:ABC transporter permease subunit [Thermoproteota archaeon]
MRVLAYFQENRNTLISAVLLTGSQALVGWIVAVALGVLTGTMVYYLKWMRRIALPVIIATQTTPIIALAPLVTLWFGYGWLAKMVIACIVAIFPVVLATYSGIAEAKPTYIYLFLLAGASEISILWNVRLKSAWSALIPALKTSIVFAVVGSIVAEFMGGNRGLGFLIMVATYGTKSNLLLASVILSALLGQLLLLCLEWGTMPFERRLGGQANQ